MRLPRFARTRTGALALVAFSIVVLIAVLGPLVAPHSISETVGASGEPPSLHALLGTDYIGRDVLSRVLHGGLSVLGAGITATLLSYLLGAIVGLIAGYSGGRLDELMMRAVDVLLAFPPLLVLLLLVSGLGTNAVVLILGVVLVQLPGISRVIRTATVETSGQGYVGAAIMRGESTPSILRREILPNIAAVGLADFGIRFAASIILIASMNYLGLGLAPPAADWGLMVSENRSYISLNVWSVLAPGLMLALLTITVNLVADAYVRSLGRSTALATSSTDGAHTVAVDTEVSPR